MNKNVLLVCIFLAGFLDARSQSISGSSLLPESDQLFNVETRAATWKPVNVSGQPFKVAYQVTNTNKAGSYNTLTYGVDSVIEKGDVLLLSFYTRSLQTKKETGESFMEVKLERKINGKYEWPPLFERGMSFGSKWTLTKIPFIAARKVQKGELFLVIKSGDFPQVYEVGGISLVNYRNTAKLEELPRTVVHYNGDAPDATWRKAAAERIEKYRKGSLDVKVLDKNGKPASGATVTVRMKKSAFAWGTATNSRVLLDTANPGSQTYRDTLLRYFNKVVFENEVKPKNWERTDHNKTIQAVQWLKIRNISARGHVMVWPSWQHSPHLFPLQNDTAALRAAILKSIEEQTTVLKGQFTEWDVINEPFAHHSIIDSLGGKKVMVDWFHAARKNTEGVKLFLNDYTMFHEKGASESFYNTVKFLKDSGAPIEGIGEQAHIGGTPPGIDYVISRLDHFAELGLPIQITEFDITSDDDDFKARYLNDFMTAMFSHPSVTGLLQWGFWAGAHWIPAAALWDADWKLRSHGKVFTDLVTKTWSTHTSGKTNKSGVYTVKAFNGEYEIVVKHAGMEIVQNVVLDSKGQVVTINL